MIEQNQHKLALSVANGQPTDTILMKYISTNGALMWLSVPIITVSRAEQLLQILKYDQHHTVACSLFAESNCSVTVTCNCNCNCIVHLIEVAEDKLILRHAISSTCWQLSTV
jgi:hypothetical protein